MSYEVFFYYQDEKHATVLIIDHENRIVKKYLNCTPSDCYNDSNLSFITVETANTLLFGLNKSYYTIFQFVADGEVTEDTKRRMYFHSKINEKMANTEYLNVIQKEYALYDNFHNCSLKYFNLVEQYNECLRHVDKNKIGLIAKKYGTGENMSDLERYHFLANLFKNKENNGFKELLEELKKDFYYAEGDKIQSEIKKAFFEYVKAYNELVSHMEEEQKLYSAKYKEKMDKFAAEGFFTYCLNTPDWPLDDDSITIDDVCNYLLDEDGLYLWNIFSTFIEHPEIGLIYQREADDLKASFSLLIQGHFWAALRNMYSLMDHHHKLCADAFNGYFEMKKKYKNGKERSEKISQLFELVSKRYEEIWDKIDLAIKEINASGSKRFVSRNAIVHGDYEKLEINPNAIDVIKIILIYVTLRQMIEHLKTIEEIVKNMDLYIIGYLANNK